MKFIKILAKWLGIFVVAILILENMPFPARLSLILVCVAFLLLCYIQNSYMKRHSLDIVRLNESINHISSIDKYFNSRDELTAMLTRASKLDILTAKRYRLIADGKRVRCSKLLKLLAQKEEASVRNVIERDALVTQDLIVKNGSGFAAMFQHSVNSYKSRFSESNIAFAERWASRLRKLEFVGCSVADTDDMEGHEFEHWCAALLMRNGFSEANVTPGSGDQGVDIVAVKDGVHYAVQCKCYQNTLNNTPVQEVYAGKEMYGCQVGAVMTNSYFTAGAKQLAEKTRVLLWDRDTLADFIKSAAENAL